MDDFLLVFAICINLQNFIIHVNKGYLKVFVFIFFCGTQLSILTNRFVFLFNINKYYIKKYKYMYFIHLVENSEMYVNILNQFFRYTSFSVTSLFCLMSTCTLTYHVHQFYENSLILLSPSILWILPI